MLTQTYVLRLGWLKKTVNPELSRGLALATYVKLEICHHFHLSTLKPTDIYRCNLSASPVQLHSLNLFQCAESNCLLTRRFVTWLVNI